MNYEKKYKEALERAKNIHKDAIDMGENIRAKQCEVIFPELKESEDEKIRDEICIYIGAKQDISLDTHNRWLSWLEKQDEQKPQRLISAEAKEEMYDKLTDKEESKFKAGDWVTCEKLNTAKIVNIDSDRYEVEFIGGNKGFPHIDYVDRLFHLWSIKDAKDGDVLSYVTDEEDLWIMIYWSLYEPYEGHVHYHALLVNDNFSDKGTCCICINDLKPATKEQRDLLFSKMKDAGYEWDSEKKELKLLITNGGDFDESENCVQNNEWSEEDNKIIEEIINDIECARAINYHAPKEGYEFRENWLKSLKDKVQPKKEWSEEDESLRLRTIGALETCKIGSPTKCVDEQISWLKSLKERYTWKPTDEQMSALHYVFQHYTPNVTDRPAWDSVKTLELMYQDLKKLKK